MVSFFFFNINSFQPQLSVWFLLHFVFHDHFSPLCCTWDLLQPKPKAKQGRLNSNLLRRHEVSMHNISDSKLFAAEHRKTAFLLQPSERTSSSSSVLAGLRGTDVLLIRNSVFWWIDMVNVTFIWSDLKSCTGKEDWKGRLQNCSGYKIKVKHLTQCSCS